MSELSDVMHEVAMANRVLANLGLATGLTSGLGHASMRLPSSPEHFVVKGREYEFDALSIVQGDDMVECDLEGFKVGGRPQLTQCSEVKIHSCIYRARPDVVSVVHVHPRYTILMSIMTGVLHPMCQEGAQLVRRPLPIYPHMKTVQSDAEGTEVATLLGEGRAVLMRGHGAVTAGHSLSEAVLGMAQLEEQARMNYLAYCAEGKGYAFAADELVAEMSGRPPLSDQPHFKDVLQGREPQRDGIWAYHTAMAAKNPRP